MRISIVIAPRIGAVHGMIGNARDLLAHVPDRAADRIGFQGERVIRLPRRYTRAWHLPRFCGRSDLNW